MNNRTIMESEKTKQLREKMDKILGSWTFCGAVQKTDGYKKSKPKNFNMSYKRNQLKKLQKKLPNNRLTRDKSRVSEILDEIVSAMSPIEE